MDLASLSLSSIPTDTAYGVAMLSKSLDAVESTGDQIVNMLDAASLERSVNPALGSNFDMYV